MQTKSSKYFSLQGAFAVRWTGRSLRRASEKALVLLDKGATNLLRQSCLVFRGVVGCSFTLGSIAPTDDALRWCYCGRLTKILWPL